MPEEDRYEIVDGELVPKEAARGPQGRAQGEAFHLLTPFRRSSGGPPDRPGGWWFATEVLIQLEPRQIFRPNLSGWRRNHMPEMPTGSPITLVPDWTGAILSPTNAGTDTVTKMRLYHRAHVSHYWLIDPERETLTVHRWTPDGYLLVLGARRGERVRAEPFEAVELQVGVLFGDDED